MKTRYNILIQYVCTYIALVPVNDKTIPNTVTLLFIQELFISIGFFVYDTLVVPIPVITMTR